MAKKYHGTSPFPAGKDHYGMPMGSHIKDINQSESVKNNVESPSKETIDKNINENVAKLRSQLIK